MAAARKCHTAETEETHQSQFEQLGDDSVEHSSVVLLIDLVGDFLDDVLGCQRGAVHLTEALRVVCGEISQRCEVVPAACRDLLFLTLDDLFLLLCSDSFYFYFELQSFLNYYLDYIHFCHYFMMRENQCLFSGAENSVCTWKTDQMYNCRSNKTSFWRKVLLHLHSYVTPPAASEGLRTTEIHSASTLLALRVG